MPFTVHSLAMAAPLGQITKKNDHIEQPAVVTFQVKRKIIQLFKNLSVQFEPNGNLILHFHSFFCLF